MLPSEVYINGTKVRLEFEKSPIDYRVTYCKKRAELEEILNYVTVREKTLLEAVEKMLLYLDDNNLL
jgi:hypothetical protein